MFVVSKPWKCLHFQHVSKVSYSWYKNRKNLKPRYRKQLVSPYFQYLKYQPSIGRQTDRRTQRQTERKGLPVSVLAAQVVTGDVKLVGLTVEV